MQNTKPKNIRNEKMQVFLINGLATYNAFLSYNFFFFCLDANMSLRVQ